MAAAAQKNPGAFVDLNIDHPPSWLPDFERLVKCPQRQACVNLSTAQRQAAFEPPRALSPASRGAGLTPQLAADFSLANSISAFSFSR